MYFTTRHTNHYEIKQINDFAKPEKAFTLFESKQDSHSIQYDNETHNYYFVSYRSGQAQIWLGNQRGVKQLSHFTNTGTSITGLKVSPNGKRLLYYRDKQFEVLDINTEDIRIVNLIDLTQLLTIIWGADSHSVIHIDKREDYQVKQYDFVKQQHKVIATLNAFKLFSNNKGIPFAFTEQGLVDLTTKKTYQLPSNIRHIAWFDQVDKYFYANDQFGQKIYRWQNKDKLADIIQIDFSVSSMDVTNKHELLLVKRKKRDVKIERLWWQPLQNSKNR
jgi:WD40 repeat protein